MTDEQIELGIKTEDKKVITLFREIAPFQSPFTMFTSRMGIRGTHSRPVGCHGGESREKESNTNKFQFTETRYEFPT